MKLVTKSPSPLLKPFVKHLWKMEVLAEDLAYSHTYFPYGSFEVICYLKNPGIMKYLDSDRRSEQPYSCYSGQLTKPFLMTFTKPCICLGISMKPWTGNVLFDVPSDKFTNELIEIDNLVREKLFMNSGQEDDYYFNELESFVLQHMRPDRIDSMSAFLAQEICRSPVRDDAKSSIDKIGLSKRRIEQRFLAATGLNIGSFTRKIRFQKAVHLLNNRPTGENLTSVGLDAGYYDQSHFISEFKHFASVSPSAFARERSDMKNILVRLSADR